jgi:N-methylhydantoinase B
LKDNMDFSTALADANGKLVAQGLTLPGHLGSIPTALESIMRQFGDNMGPGDIFIMNDPFDGGMHLPDIFVIKPLYVDGMRVAFAATVCHHTDVGGASPGVERLGLHGGLCRRAAHRADEDVRGGQA